MKVIVVRVHLKLLYSHFLNQFGYVWYVADWCVTFFSCALSGVLSSEGELHLPIPVCEGNNFLVWIYSPRLLMSEECNLPLAFALMLVWGLGGSTWNSHLK